MATKSHSITVAMATVALWLPVAVFLASYSGRVPGYEATVFRPNEGERDIY